MSDKPEQKNQPKESSKTENKAKPKCGIIMPIAGFGTYTESHWNDVLRIIKRAADKAGFEAAMVSTGADVGVIHANIINNIYSNEIAVCDVSGKNANVMFELGLRLASKLPVIIIKDELTGYSFDTSPIQHLSYRSDLRLFATLDFEDELALQMRGTYERSKQPNYKTFLDHFGSYSLANVEDKAIDLNEFMGQIFSRLDSIEQRQTSISSSSYRTFSQKAIEIADEEAVAELQQLIQPRVSDLIGDRPLADVKDYNHVRAEIRHFLNYAFTQHVANLPSEIVNKAITGAIRHHEKNRPTPPRS